MLRAILNSRGLICLLLLGILVVLLVGCYPSHPQSTFDTPGPVSRSQALIFYIILGAGVFVFVLVFGILIAAIVRFRGRPGQGDPEQIHGNNKLEVAWTVAPALLLTAVAVPTIIGIFFDANSPKPPEEGGLVVDAIGHQWWFEFRYPKESLGTDRDLVTANEMYIPVGEPINMRLDSRDVIHSFWVPKLAGKVDMIPNNDNTMWLQADEPGEYFGQCAEFCGESHAKMRFRVIAVSRDEFDAWVQRQTAPGVTPADPLAVEGRDLFMSRTAACWGCHTINSQGTERARGQVGPNLTHFASRRHMAAGIMDNNQANLRAWLRDPHRIKPGNIMARDAPTYNGAAPPLTDQQIDQLVHYLGGLE
jgi:cytochrome c oxidase subunit 2